MRAIIIDDEKRARVTLQLLLKEYCPEVEIVAQCENLPEGVKSIRKLKPDLVFLDIEMPGHSGLELLDFFDENEINFSIIFATAYNEYAIKAFKFSAIDYLLKPINPEELVSAIERMKKQNAKLENLKMLKENMASTKAKKIAVPCGNKIIFLDTTKILYIKGEGSYSEVCCLDGTKHLISRNLKNFEDIICLDENFLRVHRSYIVNMEQVVSYQKTDGGTLNLEGGKDVPVSSSKIDLILEKINLIQR
ncbi:LytR/AlgR family response regulator transcription factor [Frigoriflavimonas asaccharolytica]|uniref:Two-component system LytT family response regulator n=1 Tax=Frigoriflavimonas asaccharolytica TaxID=2735899 RepID=A0A8J8KAA9_9FLAO|nr:LytTR family DNA-binding domain-containing protein [Frigoriflavimonas asaccharolytica]NRS91279.1 two-component system LytT family response regulator [Frigoriflavimonas asaccharolytica]